MLESLNRSAGVVLGTFGLERNMVRFVGQAAHSGSTPIAMRRDAFLAAAATALECREIARRHSKPGAGVVCTVGVVKVEPGIVDRRAWRRGDIDRSARARSRRPRGDVPRGAGSVAPFCRGERRVGRVETAVSDRAASLRSAPAPPLRRVGPRGHRRCAEASVGPAARRRGDGAAHAGGHDVCLFRQGAFALQGGGHARRALPRRRSAPF